jgi:hypothetical protein
MRHGFFIGFGGVVVINTIKHFFKYRKVGTFAIFSSLPTSRVGKIPPFKLKMYQLRVTAKI